MLQRSSLDFVQCARVAEAQRKVADAVLGGPRMHSQADALIGSDNDVAAIHAQHDRAHAVDEANGFVEVLGKNNAGLTVNRRLGRILCHHLAVLKVCNIALGITRHYGQREVLGEERGHGCLVQLSAGAPTDCQEQNVRTRARVTRVTGVTRVTSVFQQPPRLHSLQRRAEASGASRVLPGSPGASRGQGPPKSSKSFQEL